ncbi:MAG: glutamate synthase-related protein, partial [Firmicutes bacterium]|nr:glutamate synthase-related protein [Bacillota bacterium]
GSALIILDDASGYQDGHISLDPSLAVAAVEEALMQHHLRRQVGIVVRSGMIRNLHDAAVLVGLGANAIDPYLIWALAGSDQIDNVMTVLRQGLEKVISTMGIHELRGYERAFSAIGLPASVGNLLGIPAYAGPDEHDWQAHRKEIAALRQAALHQPTRLAAIPRATNYFFKSLQKLAGRQISIEEYEAEARKIEEKHPIALRHTLDLDAQGRSTAAVVSLKTGMHDLPFIISSMSFGSQGETAFRAYAEAAKRLNIISMNGEGGEIVDMIGQYYSWRGYQVASGRFGINTRLLNGAQYAEIKIGQGAKPGEGGHLPGRKVSSKVASARNALPGIDLISPSNNHDLYSIEDLKQLIDELKEANPHIKVVVKVPVVPNIGMIAVGIVKTGADVINISGFEGGTGAARMHALRHVGLPADIGVPLVHNALVTSGLRDRVEIWADGGMRSAQDVTRMILLGANRVGFGTLTMMAIGCTACRQCQLDTCHVGIT